jgi:hypothetical protein
MLIIVLHKRLSNNNYNLILELLNIILLYNVNNTYIVVKIYE